MSGSELDSACVTALVSAFGTRADSVVSGTSRSWRLQRQGKNAADVSASVDGPWLHFETPLPYPRAGNLPGPRRSSGLLGSNVFLPAGMSYCVGKRGRGTFLVADISLHDHHTDREQMLCHVQAQFDAYCSALQQSPSKLAAADPRSMAGLHQPMTVDDEPGEAIRALCDNTGWDYTERGNGQLAVTLDVPNQFCQLYAYQVGDSELRLSTTLETPSELSHTSRHAAAMFLLTASRVVRMARAAVVTDGAASEYRWEVAWPQLPTPTQFHCGLSAMSIAARLTRREMQALWDESVASAYLKLRRRSAQ